jgi:hypothetical protein
VKVDSGTQQRNLIITPKDEPASFGELRAGGGVDGVWGGKGFESSESGELNDDLFWLGHRFADYSSGANLNRRSSCLRSAGTYAFHCPTVMWRNSLPNADFWSTTSPWRWVQRYAPEMERRSKVVALSRANDRHSYAAMVHANGL